MDDNGYALLADDLEEEYERRREFVNEQKQMKVMEHVERRIEGDFDVQKNWRLLAIKLGLKDNEITTLETIESRRQRVSGVLKAWKERRGAEILSLLRALRKAKLHSAVRK